VSSWAVPEKSGDFCSRGGRFGTHSSNESFAPAYYKRILFSLTSRRVVRSTFATLPSEGDRVLHSGGPRQNEKTLRRASTEERCKIAIQTNNVEVDERGYIYQWIAPTRDHILRLTGAARRR